MELGSQPCSTSLLGNFNQLLGRSLLEKLFQAKVKEYVEASPDGAGVPVFLYIDDPEFDLKNIRYRWAFLAVLLSILRMMW